MWHVLSKPMALQTGHILMSMRTPYLIVGQRKLQSKAKHKYFKTGNLTKLQI